MLSRAGKSTTNQYLAFQKIENEQASPVRARPSKESAPSGNVPPKGFAGFLAMSKKKQESDANQGAGGPAYNQDSINAQLYEKITLEMDKIQKKSNFDKLPLPKKIMKKQLEKTNKVDPKAVSEEVANIQRRHCDASFKATERNARIEAFSSKTNPPPVGKYTPRFT